VAIRVVLAEDHYLVREGLQRLLESQPEFELLAVCEDLDSLLAAIGTHKPDVVLTDIRMPPTHTDEGIRAATHLFQTDPRAGVVVLSQHDDPEYALAFLEHGARGRGYLLKEHVSDVAQLTAAIREVARGGSYVDPRVIDALVKARSRSVASPLAQLTDRERDVLAEMAQGKSNAAIAASLFLSERAVEKHIGSIFAKLHLTEERDVHRRVKAVLLFLLDRAS
jgi:DNA-binding NarL/FixJ family response regulator